MINFTKTDFGGLLTFQDEDMEKIRLLFNRALNTWQPNPPPDLLNIQKKLNE